MLRRCVVLLIMAMVAACGPAADTGDDEVQYGDPADTATTAAPAAAGGGRSRQTPRRAPAVPPAPIAEVPAAEATTTTTASAREQSLETLARGPAGSFARTLLGEGPAPRLVVDISMQAGAGPLPATVDAFVDTLEAVSRKPVAISEPATIADERRFWTADDINRAADATARARQGGGQAVVRAVFVRGGFEAGDGVLGVATRGDVIAIFVDRVAAAETPVVGKGQIEAAVAIHELGHVLGLVDLVLARGRADPQHPGHSPNRRSVMYWAVESSLVTQVLGGGPPRTFDEDDLADLGALRNGE